MQLTNIRCLKEIFWSFLYTLYHWHTRYRILRQSWSWYTFFGDDNLFVICIIYCVTHDPTSCCQQLCQEWMSLCSNRTKRRIQKVGCHAENGRRNSFLSGIIHSCELNIIHSCELNDSREVLNLRFPEIVLTRNN